MLNDLKDIKFEIEEIEYDKTLDECDELEVELDDEYSQIKSPTATIRLNDKGIVIHKKEFIGEAWVSMNYNNDGYLISMYTSESKNYFYIIRDTDNKVLRVYDPTGMNPSRKYPFFDTPNFETRDLLNWIINQNHWKKRIENVEQQNIQINARNDNAI